jgi:hypothetical protein
VLVVLNIVGQYTRYFLGHGRVFGLIDSFYLDSEHNIPTYFSSLLLLASSALLALIASSKHRVKDKFRYHWTVLSLLFAYLAVDEAAGLHEPFIQPLQRVFGASGWFLFAWVIPGLAIAALFALTYFKFLLELEKPFGKLVTTSGIVYVSGAIGMELVGGRYVESFGMQNFTYSLVTTAEEALELCGVTLFIYSLLKYMESCIPELRFQIGRSSTSVKKTA